MWCSNFFPMKMKSLQFIYMTVVWLPLMWKQAQASGPCFEDSTYFDAPTINHNMNTKTAEECQKDCQDNPRCNYWNYEVAKTGCYLKQMKGTVVADSNSLYISGPKYCPGLKLGSRCDSKSLPCTGDNTECRSYMCRCKAGFMKKGWECVLPADKAPCFEDSKYYDAPTINHNLHTKSAKECQEDCQWNKKCNYWNYEVAKSGCYLKQFKGTVVTQSDSQYVSGPKYCQGLGLGDRCNSKSLPCLTANSECRTYTCRCKDGYKQQGDECKVPADEGTCPEDSTYYDGPTINHKRTTNTAEECQRDCQDNRKCNYWNFEVTKKGCYLKQVRGNVLRDEKSLYVSGPKYCQGALRTYCTKSSACTAKDAVCRYRRCRCPHRYQEDAKNNQCIKPKPGAVLTGGLKLNSRCNKFSLHCETQNSECRGYKCRCKAGFLTKGLECVVPPKKVTLGKFCSKTQDCAATANAACLYRRCRCLPNYRKIANACIPLAANKVLTGLELGARCSSRTLNCEAANSECKGYRCRCKTGFAKQGKECAEKHVGSYCTTEAQCPGAHTVCDMKMRRCQCAAGYNQVGDKCLK